jgi:hypothetical protein
MAKFYPALTDALRDFIGRQHIFFTASAAAGSRVNLSPKGHDCLRVLGPAAVCYLDRTGSGNEAAAHLKADGRLTMMFCAFEGAPMILRLYGRGETFPRGTREYDALLAAHYAGAEPPGARQIVRLAIESVQTSCGFAVPLMDYREDREVLTRWAEQKGEAGLAAYRREKNIASIDGLPTGLAAE